jgi:hypothetical protein
MQRFVKATIACLVIAGFLAAGEITGFVTSISKDEVKVIVGKKKGEKGTEKVLKVSKELKITKGKDKTAASIDDATKMIEESKGKTKGFNAKLTTEGEGDKETVIAIQVGGGKK